MAEAVYSTTIIDACEKALYDLAKEPRTQFTKREAVAQLYDAVEQALQNHTYEEVALKLKGSGVEIAASTLKQYVLQIRRDKQGRGRRKGSRQAVKVEPEPVGKKVTAEAGRRQVNHSKAQGTAKPKGKGVANQEPQVLPGDADEIKVAY